MMKTSPAADAAPKKPKHGAGTHKQRLSAWRATTTAERQEAGRLLIAGEPPSTIIEPDEPGPPGGVIE